MEKELQNILMKPSLSRNDIELLENVKKSRAGQIMSECKKLGGAIVYRNDRITTRSYFLFNGENYDEWLKNIGGNK